MSDDASAHVLAGRLVGVTGRAETAEVTVWFAFQTTAGQSTTLESTTDEHGRFYFDLPTQRLRAARVGALLEGVQPQDLHPQGQPMEPGDVVLFVDDIVASHIRWGIGG